MADTCPGRIEIDSMLASERLYAAVLLKILFRNVLDVVVDREDGLTRIENVICTYRGELVDDGRCVVVRHHVSRPERHHVSGS
jgi:hypothetical protein